MTPDEALRELADANLRPVYLVTGEERVLVDKVISAVRKAATQGGIAGFNEDKFTAGESSIDVVLSAAKMVPMMAKRRFVLVRALERWEKKATDEEEADPAPGVRDKSLGPLDQLAEYAKAPADSTVLVLVASKLHGQRRLFTTAKKGGFHVASDPIPRRDLPIWIERAALEKGHPIAPEVADLLAEIAGPELGYITDALERLSLYVGSGAPIGEDAVAKLVTRVRQSSVWELVDAVGRRRVDRALSVLSDVCDPRDGGLPVLGAIAWSIRQLVKFDSALRDGSSPAEAAARAGAPPFKANELAQVLRRVPRGLPERWLSLLAEADIELKSSRRSARSVLEATVLQMCR